MVLTIAQCDETKKKMLELIPGDAIRLNAKDDIEYEKFCEIPHLEKISLLKKTILGSQDKIEKSNLKKALR